MAIRNPALKKAAADLDRIAAGLETSHENREFLLKNAREVTGLCGRAIISTHRGETERGTEQFERARALLKKYRKKATGDLRSHLAIAEQELAEAACVICTAQEKGVPTAKELGVTDTAYVLGLLDAVGELKRMTLEMLRAGKAEEAERVFGIAVDMYDGLSGFAVYGNSVRDIRKKIDSARITIDGMRTVIASDAIARRG